MFEELKCKLWTTLVRDALLLLRCPNPGPRLLQTHRAGPEVSCPAVVSSLLMGGNLGLYLTNSLPEKCLTWEGEGSVLAETLETALVTHRAATASLAFSALRFPL